MLLSTILNSWKYIKLVINLIHNSYRESSLIHKVLLQILLIHRKDGKLIPGNERVVFLHSKEQVCEKDLDIFHILFGVRDQCCCINYLNCTVLCLCIGHMSCNLAFCLFLEWKVYLHDILTTFIGDGLESLHNLSS